MSQNRTSKQTGHEEHTNKTSNKENTNEENATKIN